MGKKKKQFVVGVDLGGTKIYAAVVDRKGRIYGTSRRKTKHVLGFEATIERIIKTVREAIQASGLKMADIRAIGVGSPGPLNLKKGVIIDTPNLKWKNAPLKEMLQQALKKTVHVDNDGNVGVLGELGFGAAQGADDVVGLFVGTGVGGGVIIDGELLHGYNENAGELGHIILDPDGPVCGCGNKGCLEAFSSRTAIEREIRAAIEQGTRSRILENGIEADGMLHSRRIAEAYAAGDRAAKMAVNKSATYLGYAVASFLNIFNPQVVILGGGVVEAIGAPYVKIVKEVAVKNCFKIASRKVRILAASLGDNSAVLGAALLAWNAKK